MSNGYLPQNESATSAFLSSRPLTETLTEPLLHNVLENLNESVEHVKNEIFATIDAHQSHFVLTADQLKQLQQQVTGLQNHIQTLHNKLSGDTNSSLQSHVEGFKNELNEERKQEQKLKKVLAFLQSVCTIQQKLNEADNHLQSNEYDISADALISVKNILNNILSANGKDEPEVVENLKREYIQRRGYLECKLKEILQRFFTYNKNIVTVQQQLDGGEVADACEGVNEQLGTEGELSKVELSDVFDAMKLLGIAKAQMNSFLKQLIQSILTSLLHTALNLTDTTQSIEPKISINDEQQSASWTWILQKQDNQCNDSTEKNEAPSKAVVKTDGREMKVEDELNITIYKNTCRALESLAIFICEHVFIGQPELLRIFGKLWWRYITQNVANRLPPASLAAVKLLTDLEVKIQSIQLISPEEMRLHLFASEYNKKLTEQKKWKILATVREWIICDDTIIVSVSDETEIGSFTSLLVEAGISTTESSSTTAYASIPLRNQLQHCFVGGPASGGKEGARKLLLEAVAKETDSYLRLPNCGVTQNVKRIVDLIHDMLRRGRKLCQDSNKNTLNGATLSNQSGTAAERKDSENKFIGGEMSINEIYTIVRQIVTLYIVLCPTVHKQRLFSDPHFAAAFFSNCSYFCHHLTTIPLTYNKYLPKATLSSSTMAIFMDLILLLRRMQEAFYTNMMRIQQAGITKLIDSIGDVQGLSIDSKYTQTESILGGVQQHLKTLCSKWKPILPCEVLIESVSILVDVFLEHLMKIVLSSRNLSAPDASSLSHLLSSVQSQMVIIMQACIYTTNCRGAVKGIRTAGGGAYGDIECMVERMKQKLIINWDAFCLIKILLDADLPIFVSKRDKLLKYFSLDELKNLIDMNKNLPVSTADVMAMVVNRK